MNVRYISISFGYWGAGATGEEAVKNRIKAGAKKRDKAKLIRFQSELPFAPSNRLATDEEADCWVDCHGGLNWVRCEKEDVL